MRFPRLLAVTAVALLAVGPDVLGAQGNPARGLGRRGAPQGDSARRNRAQLEQQLQLRIAQMMKNQLGLTDAQMARVGEINQRYSGRRRLLLQQERELRFALREEVVAADSSRQTQVADLLDRFVRAQRQRIELLEAEQRDLAAVLTPLQRATYIGLEEQLRQRLEGLRGARGGRGGPGDLPPGAPGGARGRRVPPPGGAVPPGAPGSTPSGALLGVSPPSATQHD